MIQKSSFNALSNVDNRYQGAARRVLCVCSAGLLRSPTTAVVLQREFGYNTRSAGLYDYALIPVSQALIEWADEIVFMEEKHHQMFLRDPLLEGVDLSDLQITVLGIPDDFRYMDEELQEMIVKAYKVERGADVSVV